LAGAVVIFSVNNVKVLKNGVEHLINWNYRKGALHNCK